MSDIKDFLRKAGYFGVGAAAYIVEAGGKAIKCLVRKGETTLRDNQDTVDEIKRKAKELGEKVKDAAEKAADKAAEKAAERKAAEAAAEAAAAADDAEPTEAAEDAEPIEQPAEDAPVSEPAEVESQPVVPDAIYRTAEAAADPEEDDPRPENTANG